MDFSLSSEQEMLRAGAREFFSAEWPVTRAQEMERDHLGCPSDLWRKMADLDWMALPFDQEHNGVGGSLVDLMVLLEEMGRVNAPSLFFTSIVLGGMVVEEAAGEQHRAKLLPGIAAGDLIITLAAQADNHVLGASGVRAVSAPDGSYLLGGTALLVPDADLADYLVCPARVADRGPEGPEIGLFLIQVSGTTVPGLSRRQLATVDGGKRFEVSFEGVSARPEEILGGRGEGASALERVLEIAAVAKCAELIGGAQRVLEMAVENGKTRNQFGRPIGSFQAIQHHCTNMMVDVDLSRFLTYQAAWLLSQRSHCSKEVSIAKSFVSQAYLRVVTLGHQVLGGNGLIEEHEMHLFSKRALAAHQLFGSPDNHRERIARELGL